MKYTHILWDFNGTLLDDVACGIKCINTMLSRRNLSTVKSVEAYHRAFTFPITKYYENVGFDFSLEPFSEIAPEWIELNQINIKKAPLFPDALEVIKMIESNGVPQTIISATKQDLLQGHIKDLGITGYFDEILGLDNINAESKVGIAQNWMKKHPHTNPVFIGDTVHDAEVATSVNIDCILVSTGHQNRQTLEETGLPVYNSLLEVYPYL